MRKLIIAGGGGADDSRPLDEKFAAWVGTTGKMLYLPLADDMRIVRFAEEHQLAVLALSERSGICLENDQLLAMGFEGVRKFIGNHKQYIEVGQVIN